MNSLNVVPIEFKYLHFCYILLNIYSKYGDFNFTLYIKSSDISIDNI